VAGDIGLDVLRAVVDRFGAECGDGGLDRGGTGLYRGDDLCRHGANWDARPLIAGEMLAMPEIDVAVLLDDTYADVTLPDLPPD
jgi:hypothetical protein